MKLKVLLAGTIAALVAFSGQVTADDKGEVNVYSARKEALIEPLLAQFSEQTGIKVNLVTGKSDALLTRLENEGKISPADVFITVDAGNLHTAKEAGVLQSYDDAEIDALVDVRLRDKDSMWVGLSQRGRVIFYRKGTGWEEKILNYADLANEDIKGQLCIRSSGNIYNQSLVAATIANSGAEATQEWLNGMVENFARSPQGGDTDQLRAVAAGACELAVANTYYYGRLGRSDKAEDREVYENVGIIWPNQDSTGVHMNVSGIGIAKHAKNVEQAKALIRFLLSEASQTWYADVNNEYPAVAGVAVPEELGKWGEFKTDPLNLTVLGENNRQAVELMDKAGWK